MIFVSIKHLFTTHEVEMRSKLVSSVERNAKKHEGIYIRECNYQSRTFLLCDLKYLWLF